MDSSDSRLFDTLSLRFEYRSRKKLPYTKGEGNLSSFPLVTLFGYFCRVLNFRERGGDNRVRAKCLHFSAPLIEANGAIDQISFIIP